MVAAGVAAVLAWWQLRDQPDTTAGRGDVTLTLAPVVCVVATTLVVVRLVPVLLRAAARQALRSPALVLPLSAQQAARRPHPGTAMALIATGGRDGDVRARAPLDLGTITGGPGGPARRHRPEPRRTHDADRGRCGGRARRGRRAVHGRLGGRSTDR